MLRKLGMQVLLDVFRPSHGEAFLQKNYLAWAKYTLRLYKVELHVEGAEHLPKDGRKTVLLCNHQSQIDIPALVAASERSLGFVAKKELSRIPMVSYWMKRVGCLFIDRKNNSAAHRALELAAQQMHIPLVVFPEGTRSKNGQFLPVKNGGFRLALLADALALPVLIKNSREALENRQPKKASVHVYIHFFPPMPTHQLPEDKDGIGNLRNYVLQCWNTTLPSDTPS